MEAISSSSNVHIIKSPVVIDGILREWGDFLFYKPPKKGSVRTVRGFKKQEEKSQFFFAVPLRKKLALTTAKAPEVMVKISGGGKNLQHIKDHIDYISRNGKVPLEDEQGNISSGYKDLQDLKRTWELGKFGLPLQGDRRKEAFNIVLSMPPGTPRDAVLNAARNFAKERFFNHQYVFAIHDDEAHPHVHLCVKALDMTQVRLNPRKADLQQWREHFAEKMREQGVQANATPRRA